MSRWALLLMIVRGIRGILNSYDVGIDTGVVRGYIRNDGDGEYFGFLGIPYAAPPTLKNRFKDPVRPAAWHGVLYANRTIQCPQTTAIETFGTEDCLVLNVFTPYRPKKALLPVLVYIHGGAFIRGSAPTRGLGPLTKQDLIVVTINYRLGVLGFLCLGIDGALGNAGLKDQTAALQWIQRNIIQFGGNPEQVTLYGMGAGGASVEFHVLSGASEGLFHRAIVESSSVSSVSSIDYQPVNTAASFAHMFQTGKITGVTELLRFLQHIPVHELTENNYLYASRLIDGRSGFAPCIEKKSHWCRSFISDPPVFNLKIQNYSRVPIMFIFASLEGLFLRSPEYYQQNYVGRMNKNFVDFLPADLVFETMDIKRKVANYVKYSYFGNRTVNDENLVAYLRYFGDYLVLHGLLKSAELHSRAGAAVYMMEFGYRGDLGGTDDYFRCIRVAGHGDITKHVILTKPVWSWNDRRMVDRMTTTVSNFATFGNPLPKPTQLLPITWPELNQGYKNCLFMGNALKIFQDPYWDRKRFWDEMYRKYGRPEKNEVDGDRARAIITFCLQIIIVIFS